MPKTFLCLLLLLPLLAHAQMDPPLVASGSYQSDGHQWTFVVGDLAILTLQTANTMWSQGSVQPDLSIVPIHQTDLPDVTIMLYPNPTADVLYFKISRPIAAKDLKMDVFDTNGHAVSQISTLVANQEIASVSLAALPAGAYFIRLSDPQGRQTSIPFQKI